MKDRATAYLVAVRSRPHSEALYGTDVVKGDKIVLITSSIDKDKRVVLANSIIKPAGYILSAGDIPYILIERNDQRAETLYGTVVPSDQQVVLMYDQIGLPSSRDDTWARSSFVLRFAIAKNVLSVQDELRMLTSGREDTLKDSKVAARA